MKNDSKEIPLPPSRVNIDDFREVSARIIGASLVSDVAYRRLEWLSDRIGYRFSGSESLERAIDWALSEMKRDELDKVRPEKVMVPHWVRGEESLEIISPVTRKIAMLGLGNSVGTTPKGLSADTIVVRSFEELDSRGETVRGKIVVYNAPFTNYEETVPYRISGPSFASKHGAIATIVKSITPHSLQTLHAGSLEYLGDLPKIPAAAITIESAELLQRIQDCGERPHLHLKMSAKLLPDAESANVIAEIEGRERSDEVVLIGGHLDSWDVTPGAHDDGGGCIVSWETIRLLKTLGLRPRRTIRAVLFTNEENGLRGGKGYCETHEAELCNHVLAIESDYGVFRPVGFGLSKKATPQARADFIEIGKLLRGIQADQIAPDGDGVDIGPIMQKGVLGASLDVDSTSYFDIHHTEADTFDKVSPQDLAACVAAMAVMSYVVADMPHRL